MPYTVNTGLQCINATNGADITINSQSGTTVTVKGNVASAYLGFNFQTLYTIKTIFKRTRQTRWFNCFNKWKITS